MEARNSAKPVVVMLVILGAVALPVSAQHVYTYTGRFDLPIPANPDDTKGWMNDAVVEIPDHFLLYDLDVGITLTHTNAFDLQLFLQSPAGTKICLNMYDPYSGFFEAPNYTQTIFDDEAELPIEQAEAPFTGRFRPLAGFSLSAFDGQDAFGPWSLQIYDAFYSDAGALNIFELIITIPEPATLVLFILTAALLRLSKPRRKLTPR